ncbi:sensor histidine kinase [Gephyromycinifex aptenodytis]|uniref:sensor histidine kinase n=1 Tax=Gephyromycinifex aptenodytis TaxID=2716227 RepID=UPI001445A0B1|nr:histidine kinase [Gephyromycinifex aptenodytis]
MRRPPVIDLVLGGLALCVSAMEATFILEYGPYWAYLANLAIHLVLSVALLLRRTKPRTAFIVTFAAMAALALVVFTSPVNLGVTPLLFCAPISLWTVTRWVPNPWWGLAGLLLTLVGSFGSPVVQMWTRASLLLHVLLCVITYLWAATLARNDAAHRRAVARQQRQARQAAQEAAQSAAAQERIRIARELHDIVAHSLTVVQVQATSGLAIGTPEAVRSALENTRDASRDALAEVRSLVGVLRAQDQTPVGDVTTIPYLVHQARANGVAITTELPDPDTLRAWQSSWPTPARLAMVRAVQEALTNVVKHGGPNPQAHLRVSQEGQDVLMHLSNPIPASDGSQVAPSERGAGHDLLGLRERANLVGGRFSAERVEDEFVVRFSAPLSSATTTGLQTS